MKKLLFNALFSISSLTAFCQQANPGNFDKMVDFLPPAPNAAAIIKHSALTINKNTGSPSISIPLFSIKGNKLSAGVSLGYSSTGIKVDDIASRAGMGWVLNSGGVITRTIRGVPDEYNTRLVPYSPLMANCGTYNFFNNVTSSSSCMGSGCNGYDTEPDLYNFNMNGISGSFVFDANMQPVLIPADKLKIEYNFYSTAWNFKITATDGIIYYFGGSTATEKTKRDNSCGKTYSSYMPTSWYLIKIEHPNGEAINYTYTPFTYSYDNGISETQNWAYWMIDYDVQGNNSGGVSCPTGTCPPAQPTKICVNIARTQGVLLSSITNSNSTISFQYISRSDCEDKLVSSISQYSGSQLIGSYNLVYNQQGSNMDYVNQNALGYSYSVTPYLISLEEKSSDLQLSKTHRFVYNDPGNRPPRLSFSQDHWGYFNGRINTSFIPKPTDIVLRLRFPQATANREPEPSFVGKGMLTKIVYPTGGMDNIEYESNEMQAIDPSYKTYHEFNCSVTGIGNGPWTEVSRSVSFTTDNQQTIELVINSIDNTGNGGFDPIHENSKVQVVNSSGAIILTETFTPGVVYTRYLSYLPAGTYTMTYRAQGQSVTTNVTMKYYPLTVTTSNLNVIVGGVRVKRVLTGNPTEQTMVKRYYYAEPDNLNLSSLYTVRWPKYDKNYRNTMACTLGIAGGGGSPPGQSPTQAYCSLTSMYSGSLTNLFNYGSALVSYGSVIESTGENFEGGAVQSKFFVGSDVPGVVEWGDDITGAPLTNSSNIFNGKPQEETIFKKSNSPTFSLIPVKKTIYNYTIDSRNQQVLSGYTINNKYAIYQALPSSNCPGNTNISPAITNAYDMVRYYIYSWWVHLQTVTETLYDENGQNPVTNITNSYFDNEQNQQLYRSETTNSNGQLIKNSFTYPHDYIGYPVYDAMRNLNMITPTVSSKTENNGLEISKEIIDYGNNGNNNFAPIDVKKSVKGNTPEIEGTIDQYDDKGNILQFTNKANIITAIIWGYGKLYPVAKVVGTTYNNAIAQLSIPITSLQLLDGEPLRQELNLIRTNLPSARVTSYTYKPLTGVTSITDPNNKTNTYEYDSFNRLLHIKDQDGNVVKKNEYIYAIPDPISTSTIYFNQPITQSIQCLSCAGSYTGSFVSYTIPFGKYYSLVSQADADAQAGADTGGQEYANKYGICTNAIACSGVGYKIVNCACQLGVKVCENTTNNGGGSYTIIYHYHWTDNTNSPQIVETISCIGADKKMINCTCETGVRVCEYIDNNGGGSYTLHYHYHWSDNTNGPSIAETITCSGPDKKIINCFCETGVKHYVSSVLTTKFSNNGCAVGTWKCTYYYVWSDGSNSLPTYYYDCAATTCLFIEE